MAKPVVPVVIATIMMLHLPAMGSEISTDTLDGSAWVLSELPSADLLDGVTATLAFDGNAVAGTDGCNRFRGSYTINDDELLFGQLAGTMMACPEPVMTQAGLYMAALEAARGARHEDGRLTLVDADGQPVASFNIESQTLADTRWIVTGYNNGKGGVVSIAAETSLTLEFDESGSAAGSAGCNNYRADYTVDGNSVAFGLPIATRRVCPEEVMAQETAFLEALPRGTTFRIEANRLEIRDDGGALQLAARRAD